MPYIVHIIEIQSMRNFYSALYCQYSHQVPWFCPAPASSPTRQLLTYALRALLAWGCLEAVTHALPYNAIAKHHVLDWLAAQQAAGGPGAQGLPAPRPLHYAITGYWVLVFMWLKVRSSRGLRCGLHVA